MPLNRYSDGRSLALGLRSVNAGALARYGAARYLWGVMSDQNDSGEDFNYLVVRWMINLAALGLTAGLVAMLVFCALTID